VIVTTDPHDLTIRISVVICTRNRADLLRTAIASVVEQDFPRSDYELVVVDNGSTDHTRTVVSGFETAGNVVYLREDTVGLCVARNAGWRACRGPHVAYFDDDAVAHSGWLSAIGDTIERCGATLGVAGGRVDPIWQGTRPEWLSDRIAGSLTIVDWGSCEQEITDLARSWLVGANMVIPKALLERVGGFDPRLDRYGENLLSSGDVFLQKKIAELGYRIVYVPEIAISHLVPPARLDQRWFRSRFYWQGISDAVMYRIERTPDRRRRVRTALARAARLLRSPGRLRALVFPTTDPDRFTQKCFALIDVGFIRGLLVDKRR
jgi:glycosyltransferase involved in cell wall biosynthesis